MTKDKGLDWGKNTPAPLKSVAKLPLTPGSPAWPHCRNEGPLQNLFSQGCCTWGWGCPLKNCL